jgi:hypothetical protein
LRPLWQNLFSREYLSSFSTKFGSPSCGGRGWLSPHSNQTRDKRASDIWTLYHDSPPSVQRLDRRRTAGSKILAHLISQASRWTECLKCFVASDRVSCSVVSAPLFPLRLRSDCCLALVRPCSGNLGVRGTCIYAFVAEWNRNI